MLNTLNHASMSLFPFSEFQIQAKKAILWILFQHHRYRFCSLNRQLGPNLNLNLPIVLRLLSHQIFTKIETFTVIEAIA